jgi:predicted  nucleic acid-binding Zn-ribbon protein
MATSKKTNTVIPPVVEGETFTSLQIAKDLGSDVSMETKLRLLYRLQQTDTRIDKIYLLRGELPLEVQDLEDEIEGLNTRIAHLEKDIKDGEAFIAQKKIDIESSKALIEKYEAQRNNVKNNREYDSLSKEIEFQSLEIELAEKKINDTGKQLVEKKNALVEATAVLEGRSEDLENKRKELETIIEETQKEEEMLLKQSEELQAQIEPRMLNAYKKVRSNLRNKMAVVTVKRDACGGCFNKIPPQRQLDIALSKKIIVCEYCGRILISPEFENEQ